MFQTDKTVLLIIDIQGKLASLVHEEEKVQANTVALIKTAQAMSIPVIHTEQVPEKLGKTIPDIAQLVRGSEAIAKAGFSCFSSQEFIQKLTSLDRKQVIVAGIETHVCVYQTVADLLERKFQVQVVSDAVSSRTEENRIIALERIKKLGADITSTEMIICELLKTSEHPQFRDIIKLIK